MRGSATETRGDSCAGWPHSLYTWSAALPMEPVRACMHTHTRTHAHVCTHARGHACTHTHMQAHTCAHTCTETRAHAHTYTHAHTRSSVERPSSGACNLTLESLAPGATSLHLRPHAGGLLKPGCACFHPEETSEFLRNSWHASFVFCLFVLLDAGIYMPRF